MENGRLHQDTGIVGRVGPSNHELNGGRADRPMERNNFGGGYGADYCNKWKECGDRHSGRVACSQITLGFLVIFT